MLHRWSAPLNPLCLRLLIAACFILTVLGATGSSARSADMPPLPDEALLMMPAIVYPDGQTMTDISGTVTVTYRAAGSYSFRKNYNAKNDLMEQVMLDMTMVVRCEHTSKSETVTVTVQGTKITTEDAPARGWDPKKFHYSCGYWYYPSLHRTTKETYSGRTVKQFNGRAIQSFTWSKQLKLACFQAQLGGEPGWPTIYVNTPVKRHVEIEERVDDKTERESRDEDLSFMATIPSRGVSGSRWAELAAQPKNQGLLFGGWIESSSPQGTSSGSFSLPSFFKDFHWDGEWVYRQSGEDPYKKPEVDHMIIWPGSVQVVWGLGSKMPQGKMIIGPEDNAEYQKWTPVPVDDARYGAGSPVGFTARILPKEEGKPAPVGRIHFWLCDVSREKGTCSNYPLKGGTEDDLRFKPGQKGIIIDGNNPRHAYTEKACSEASVEVEATDTGAYGSVQATCDDLGLVAEDERTKLQSIAIPMDDNANHAADAWERETGVYEKNYMPGDDDDDQPADQRRNGDGYTLYEEYRGFMTRNGFVRTHPQKKDLFVYDPDGLVKQWYEPYNPAKLVLHYIDPEMMRFTGESNNPENRWVNYNSSEDKWYARQYALYVKQWPTMSDQVVGEASWHTLADGLNGINPAYAGFKEPLKSTYIIKIAPGTLEKCLAGVKDPAVRQAAYNALMITSVIHEIGHGLGITHHKESENETDESIQGGVFDCAMRYNIKAEYEHPELLKPQARFCKDGEVWKKSVEKTNPDGTKTGTFQDMPSHNCFGQIDVKSDP